MGWLIQILDNSSPGVNENDVTYTSMPSFLKGDSSRPTSHSICWRRRHSVDLFHGVLSHDEPFLNRKLSKVWKKADPACFRGFITLEYDWRKPRQHLASWWPWHNSPGTNFISHGSWCGICGGQCSIGDDILEVHYYYFLLSILLRGVFTIIHRRKPCF